MESSIQVQAGLAVANNQAFIQAKRAVQLASLFTTDFSGKGEEEGKTVVVDVYSGNASVFNPTTNDYEHVDGKIIPVRVSLDTVVKATFKITQADLNDINKTSKFRNCGIAGGRMVSDDLETILSNLLTYSGREDAITGFTVGTMGTKIYEKIGAKYNPRTCNIILTPKFYGAVLDDAKDKGVLNSNNFADVAEALGRLYGFKAIFCLGKLSAADSGSTSKGAGFVVPEDAIAIAARAIEEAVPGTYQNFSTEVDPESGLPMTSFIHGSPAKNAAFLNTASQIGARLTKENVMVDSVSTPNGAPGYIQLVTA